MCLFIGLICKLKSQWIIGGFHIFPIQILIYFLALLGVLRPEVCFSVKLPFKISISRHFHKQFCELFLVCLNVNICKIRTSSVTLFNNLCIFAHRCKKVLLLKIYPIVNLTIYFYLDFTIIYTQHMLHGGHIHSFLF